MAITSISPSPRTCRDRAVVAKFKAAILAGILADYSTKIIAAEVDCTQGTACRWINLLGYRSMKVSDAERAAIMRMRKEGA